MRINHPHHVKLDKVVEMLNEKYNQTNKDYDMFHGVSSEEIIRFDDETAITFWNLGVVVCISSFIYFVSEDDGHWTLPKEDYSFGHLPTPFDITFVDSLSKALERLNKYVEENGKPVYFSGFKPKTLCGYKLG